jgi:integrase
MTTVKAFIRASAKSKKDAVVRLRLLYGKNGQLFYKTDLKINPDLWDSKTEHIKNRALYDNTARIQFNAAVDQYKSAMLTVFDQAENKEALAESDFLSLMMDKQLHPENYVESDKVDGHDFSNMDFFELWDKFLEYKNYPETHRKSYQVLIRLLHRFEAYECIAHNEAVRLDVNHLTNDLLIELRDFILNEYLLKGKLKFRSIYDRFPETRAIEERGYNTMVRYMRRMRTFVKWCISEEIIAKDPFAKFTIGDTHDGKPYYINIEERDQITETDLRAVWNAMPIAKKKLCCKHVSSTTIDRLEQQRDIFIFQCMVGCRVGDLLSFTRDNITDGILAYVPHKTKDNSMSVQVTVPLNDTAKKIVDKYKDYPCKDNALLPFISSQKYNDDIKSIFTLCGITRKVPVLNTVNGEYEMRPLNEVASSHMARRTFIGNLYKKVKDPALIGKLSGHVEGSKAFARYRDIDMDMKQELVNLLE